MRNCKIRWFLSSLIILIIGMTLIAPVVACYTSDEQTSQSSSSSSSSQSSQSIAVSEKDNKKMDEYRKKMKTLYTSSKKKLNSAQAQLKKTEGYTSSIYSKSVKSGKNLLKKSKTTIKNAKTYLTAVKGYLNTYTTVYKNYNTLIKKYKNNKDFYTKSTKILKNECYQNYSTVKATYQKIVKQYNSDKASVTNFESFLKTLKNKLGKVSTNMSSVVGFTTKELKYLLSNTAVVKGSKKSQIISALSKYLPQSCKKYKVNEIGAISIMAYETGRFTSPLCIYSNNFGGLMGSHGFMSFSSMESGITNMVKCVRGNMGRGSSLYAINTTYCPGYYGWTTNVELFIKEIKNFKSKI